MPSVFRRTISALIAAAALLSSAAVADVGALSQCKPGPWGRIEYQTVFLEAPSWIIDQFPLPSIQPRWCFPTTSVDDLRRFLKEAGVDKDLVEKWTRDSRCKPLDGFVPIFPSPAEVESLTAQSRSTIYPELAKLTINEFFNSPIYINAKNVAEWLRGTSLPPKIVELISKLAYYDHGALLFSNVATLLSHAESEAEARQWLKEITRTRALLAYLRLGPGDDLKSVADYWSAGLRRKDVLPLLESVAETSGGDRLDLTHLLPAQPRKLIYTYPSQDAALFGQTPNCHWTSLNFFNYYSQNIYLDLKLAASGVLANYRVVPEANMLGDVLFFLDADGNAFHSCVYIADNLVYTKNGDNPLAPWILTTVDDVKTIYLRQPGSKISIFRKQDARQSQLPKLKKGKSLARESKN